MLYLQAERLLYKQVSCQAKKLVAISVISILITEKKEKLEQIFYIWYFIIFKDQTKTLLDLKSKVNILK